MSNWDDFQRWLCQRFGFQKGWKGEENECKGEGIYALEAKLRAVPKWIMGGMIQAEEYAEREGMRFPVLVLGTPGARRTKSLVVMRMDDWEALHVHLRTEGWDEYEQLLRLGGD